MHLYIWSLLGFPRLGRLRTEKASEFFLDPRHPAKMQNALRVRKRTDLLDLIRNWTRTLVGQPKRKLSITHRRIDRFSSLKRLLSLSRKEGGDEKSDRFVRAAIKYNSEKRRRATCEWIEVRCLISGAREQHNQIFLLPVSGSLCFEARFCLHYHCAPRPEQERKWSEPLTGKKIYLNMLLLCTRDLMSVREQSMHLNLLTACCRPTSKQNFGCHSQTLLFCRN